MNFRVIAGTLGLILLALLASSGLADPGHLVAPQAGAVLGLDHTPWLRSWVDSSTSDRIGYYPDIAFNPADGLPYLTYYDMINHDLVLASPASPVGSGNCGSGNAWWCRVADGDGLEGRSTDDVGQFSSIDFFSNQFGWKLGISYYDATTAALKYAEWFDPAVGSGHWTIVTVQDYWGWSFGKYTSLHYDLGGLAYIAHYAESVQFNDWLFLSYQVTSGGNCGSDDAAGKWNCLSVDGGAGNGQYASLDVAFDNFVYLAYYDEEHGDLKYAWNSGIGQCGDGFICDAIEGEIADVGLFPSIIAPKSVGEPIRIAYYDRTSGNLRYATSRADGGNCDLITDWDCMKVDEMGPNRTRQSISMKLDASGYPLIAYQDASNEFGAAMLNIARPEQVYGLPAGNCGDIPPGGLTQVWHCRTIDTAGYGYGYVDVADFTALAFDPHGLAAIAYFETDESDYSTALKIAFQRLGFYLPVMVK